MGHTPVHKRLGLQQVFDFKAIVIYTCTIPVTMATDYIILHGVGLVHTTNNTVVHRRSCTYIHGIHFVISEMTIAAGKQNACSHAGIGYTQESNGDSTDRALLSVTT